MSDFPATPSASTPEATPSALAAGSSSGLDTPVPGISPAPSGEPVAPSEVPASSAVTVVSTFPEHLLHLPTWREGVMGLLLLALLVILGASRARALVRADGSQPPSPASGTSPLLDPGSLLARMSTGLHPVREHLASGIRAVDRLRLSIGQTSRKLTECSRLSQDLAEQASGLQSHLLRAALPPQGANLAPGLHRLATDLAFAAGQADVATQASRVAGELRRMAQELEHREGTVTVAYLVELIAAWSSRCDQLTRQLSDLELESMHGGAIETLRDDLMGALGQTHALADRIRDLESRLAGPEKET
ncbi:MAG: hypothetical protein VKP72_02250 [bacterium]|nr:hypothetical protein [bacterium]